MDTLYCHSAAVKGKPRVTVAGIVLDNTLRVGISRCSAKDAYVKKLGNTMAQGRANSKKAHVFEVLADKPLIPQFITIANTIIAQEGGVVKPRRNPGTTVLTAV